MGSEAVGLGVLVGLSASLHLAAEQYFMKQALLHTALIVIIVLESKCVWCDCRRGRGEEGAGLNERGEMRVEIEGGLAALLMKQLQSKVFHSGA